MAERVRESVEATRFAVPTSAQPIGVTLSLGVASFPAHGVTPTSRRPPGRPRGVSREGVQAATASAPRTPTAAPPDAGGAAPTWSAPTTVGDAAARGSEPTAEILAADLLSRARELTRVTSAERAGTEDTLPGFGGLVERAGDERSLGVARGLTTSVVAVCAILALGGLVLTPGAWMDGDYGVVGQALVAVLGFAAIAANGAAGRAISRASAEVVRLRHENRVLTQSLEETRTVARRLARQAAALVEGRASEDDLDSTSDSLSSESTRDEWLEVIARAARRQRAGDVPRKHPNPLAADERRDQDAPRRPRLRPRATRAESRSLPWHSCQGRHTGISGQAP